MQKSEWAEMNWLLVEILFTSISRDDSGLTAILFTKEHNNGLWLFGPVMQQSTLWDQYQKWVHMPTLIKRWYCNHSSLTSPTTQIPDRCQQWSWHLYCMGKYTDPMAARPALVAARMEIAFCSQNSLWSWLVYIFYWTVLLWHTLCAKWFLIC